MSVAQAHNYSRSQYCKGIFWPQAPVIMPRVASLLMAVCIGWSSQHALAQQNEQRVALMIGNSAYKEAPLHNPVNDATDMAATLRTNADTRQADPGATPWAGTDSKEQRADSANLRRFTK